MSHTSNSKRIASLGGATAAPQARDAREIMSRHRITGGKGRKKPLGAKKAAKKDKKTTRSVAAADAAAAKRSATASRRMAVRGPKATSLAQALGKCPRDCVVLIHGGRGSGKGLVESNGPAEEGCEGKTCLCLSLTKSSCKKHPSRIKVRTGHYIVGKTRRRAVWVPKVLVDKGIIKVKKDVKFRMNKYGGKPL